MTLLHHDQEALLADIASGKAQFVSMDQALEFARNQKSIESFQQVRMAVREWLMVRIEKISGMAERSESDMEVEYFRGASDQFQQALDQLNADQDAFIPVHPNARLGILIPADPSRNRDSIVNGTMLD